ncbi:biotin-dependent carboxyltransferase family protein [Croceitalea rosinachiae]|uniref:Biotin-dependent carboxyltransferase family protein n=1 Tax=Croceitalea rosinachiae TaxID=3075596 RepID=A0ABU3AC27_9FLAO|nr:biotin-dependent carboxyltransferase family protein [Croceitalea sp. F388]MDT0607735.1 biotin-dependent carboxyltransferase family protein [Croceitalea sp. F388]
MLKVLKPGFFTSIQDNGRYGYRNKGVPISGAMDSRALNMVNSLLENPVNAAALEITMTGPTLIFEEETYVSLSGGVISATLNNEPIENYKVYKVEKGDIISYGRLESGFRGYLAVKGGFSLKKTLGSSSQYFPLTAKRCISEKDEIPFEPTLNFVPKISELKIDSYLTEKQLQVSRGPEYTILNDKQLEALFSKGFTVAKENNRMAYQVSEFIEGHSIPMLTSATLPGTIQLTPAGKLIILMKDGQTTGGYPRILQLTEEAVCVLAQKKSGDSINLKLN